MLSYCHVVQPLVVKEARKAKTTLPTGLCRKRLTVLSVKKKNTCYSSKATFANSFTW